MEQVLPLSPGSNVPLGKVKKPVDLTIMLVLKSVGSAGFAGH